jgi:hypothetical protein
MSANTNQEQEIDLGQLFGKVGKLFKNLGDTIFRMIQFVTKNFIVLLVLVGLGFGLGLFLDSKANSYEHKIIVQPNFNSVDYLYNKVNLINSKIQNNDTVFLKSIGIEGPKKLTSVTVKPIVDIYNFINQHTVNIQNAQNTQNYELVKLMSESSDISKVIKDTVTSKNYENHLITVKTDGLTTDKKTMQPILEYLNKSPFYESIQKVLLENMKFKIEQDHITIKQIDTILSSFSKRSKNSSNDKMVYYNENTQLNDIISTRTGLVYNQGFQNAQLEIYNKVIKDKSQVLNIKDTKGISNKMKFVLPLLFIFIFLFFVYAKNFYNSHKLKQSK